MITMNDLLYVGMDSLVYIKPERAGDIPEVGETGHDPEAILYSVFNAKGMRRAVLTDYDSAVRASLAHDLAPVHIQ